MTTCRATPFALVSLLALQACSSASGSSVPSAGPDAQPQPEASDDEAGPGADASVTDASVDAAPQDAPTDGIPLQEAASPDQESPDAQETDVTEPPDADEPPGEAGMDAAQPEAGPEPQPEAGPDAASWPVSPGVYTYSRITTYGLVNPPAVAWHPSGTYALILDGYDLVYQFDPAASSLTQVASAGASVKWRDLTFTPDGAHAVLLGNNTSTNEGMLFLWDHETLSLEEMAGQRFAGGTYEALEYAPDGSTARLLGSSKAPNYVATVWTFDVSAGKTMPLAKATSAGCQDIAWATDVYGAPALAIVCGENGAQLMHIDGGNQFVVHALNAGNTSRVAGRPQGDYALGICWSSSPGKLYRFAQGLWDSDYYSPGKLGIFQIEFSPDGLRALLLGGYGGNPPVGQVYEYRHDLLTSADIYDVSIPNFGAAPYNADTYVELNDAAWRPGCDGGLIVGGSNAYSSTKGYVIRFAIDNGIACPN